MDTAHPLAECVELKEWRLLLLDTQLPGHPSGALGRDKLAALMAQLEKSSTSTVIAMHHPPVDVGATWMDAINLQDKADFWAVLSGYPQVKMVLFGHAHQAYCQKKELANFSVAVYGSPATADQFLPHAEAFAVDDVSLPGYRVIDFEGASWRTRIARVTP